MKFVHAAAIGGSLGSITPGSVLSVKALIGMSSLERS